MSVLKRFRTVSEYQPLTDAKDLRGQLMNWALNENNIPKQKRVLFLEDLKNICNSLVHNIKEAMKAYPKDEESLNRRKHCLSLALDNCIDLWDELQFIDDVQTFSNPINLDKLEPCLTLLFKEYNALKKSRDNAKIITKDKKS